MLKTCNGPFYKRVSTLSQDVFKEMASPRDPKDFSVFNVRCLGKIKFLGDYFFNDLIFKRRNTSANLGIFIHAWIVRSPTQIS